MALDPSNEITAEHSPNVLSNLRDQVGKALHSLRENDPNNVNIKQLRLLNRFIDK